jgi:hypothetical protein
VHRNVICNLSSYGLFHAVCLFRINVASGTWCSTVNSVKFNKTDAYIFFRVGIDYIFLTTHHAERSTGSSDTDEIHWLFYFRNLHFPMYENIFYVRGVCRRTRNYLNISFRILRKRKTVKLRKLVKLTLFDKTRNVASLAHDTVLCQKYCSFNTIIW